MTALAAALVLAPQSSPADDAKPAAPPAAEKTASATKFYGKISAVNTNEMTFSIGDQIYVITSTTAMTKNDKPAKLADAVVGEPARGSYVTGSDGKMNVTKVRFGKKVGGKAGGKAGGHKKPAEADATHPATGNASSTSDTKSQ